MSTALDIANTIRQQIGTNTLMSIGAHRLVALPETDKMLGGLQFKVGRNPKMKQGGWVSVILNFDDTYTVTIKNAHGRVLLDASNVYCDNLGGREGIIESVTG